MKLERSFYTRNDVVLIARELLGKVIYTKIDREITAGVIIETEAYEGVTDRASHAYGNRRTARTGIMYKKGGIVYVYLCYGIHHLFNVVSNVEEIPHAVLLRGIYPFKGLEIMRRRSGKNLNNRNFSDGPGKASKALGIEVNLNGTDLVNENIWIEDISLNIPNNQIYTGPRIGVQYAGEDAKLPYRFLIKDNEYIKKNLPEI